MSKYIMFQGTSSNVGKSIITAAFCRIFKQKGYKVVPFKAQNMSRNSYIIENGDEMAVAQVLQACAAKIKPLASMNPVLLKPTGNKTSQVIVLGKTVATMNVKQYHEQFAPKAFEIVAKSAKELSDNADIMVVEGAGSPAEINLKAHDIVNMKVAKHLQAPVILITDINRGGAFASLIGTLELLDKDERALIKGFIINKFRGDVTLLQPAIDFIEQKTNIPVLGVMPYVENLEIAEEDSIELERDFTIQCEQLDNSFDRLAKITKENVDIEKIYKIMNLN